MSALLFLRRIPTLVWLVLACAGLVGGAAYSVLSWGNRREAKGRNDTQFDAHVTAAQWEGKNAVLQGELAAAQHRVDTVRIAQRVDIAASKAATDRLYASLADQDSATLANATAQRVAQSARVLAVANDSLVRNTQQLETAQQAADSAHAAVHATDSTMIHAQAVVINAKSDTIATVTKQRDDKVSKGKVALIGSAAAGSGYILGKAIEKVVRAVVHQ